MTVQLTAVNHLKDTKTRLYFFDRAYLAVPPNTANFRISARDTKPGVTVAASKGDHTLLRIDFGKRHLRMAISDLSHTLRHPHRHRHRAQPVRDTSRADGLLAQQPVRQRDALVHGPSGQPVHPDRREHEPGTGQRLVVIFEGRDTSGKGGSIEMIAHLLNPRQCRIAALQRL